jgi:hypothetical protein
MVDSRFSPLTNRVVRHSREAYELTLGCWAEFDEEPDPEENL